MAEPKHTFSAAIRYFRGKKGMTIEQVAEKSGLVYSTISRYENGKRVHPNIKTIELICIALEIEPLEVYKFIYEGPGEQK